jgi:addiction module HigA family antidote
MRSKRAERNGLPTIHPGEFLSEVLTELDVSQSDFARALGVSKMRISHIMRGTRPVTAEIALLLGKALDQTPDYWMNLQMDFDVKTAAKTLKKQVRQVKPLHRAA